MTIPTTCPHCRSSFRLADEMRGKRVRCKSCQEPFVVRPDEDDVADAVPVRERIRGERPSPAPAPRRRRDEDEDAPRRPGRRSIERPPSGGGLAVGLILGGVAALGLIVLTVAGGAAYFFLKPAAPAPAGAPVAMAPAQPVVANPAPPANPPVAAAPLAPPAPPANPAPPDQPRRPRRPAGPANPANVAAAPAAPAGPAGLRYRWDGAPHVYRVRAEVDAPGGAETTQGTCVVYSKPGDRPAAVEEERKATGTGFVVNANGYLVTCAHVVADAKKVEVALGGKSYPAKVLAVDYDHDIAVIQIDARNLPVLPLADSDAARKGEEVRALGFPLSSVLGETLKATRGTLSGIHTNKKTGKKVFHIDAPINPGNSGGPLVSETGAVLGVNSAKLTGAGVSNVGFATPSNEVKKLLAARSVSFTKGGGAGKLEGVALVARTEPAVALITVTLGPDVSAETFHLTCRGALVKRQQPAPQPRGVRRPGRPAVSRSPSSPSQIHMDSAGRILDASGGTQLPALLGDVGQFLIDPLPQDNRPTWEFSNSVNVGESGGAPAGPRGWRPHTFGGRPFGPQPAQPQPKNVRVATEHVTFRRGEAAGHLLTLHKHYELKVPAAGTSPAMTLTSDEQIQFDTRAGMPRSIDCKGTLALSTTNATIRVPLKVTYTLVEGAEREKILHPPPPPKVEPKAYTDQEMLQLLAELRGADENKKWAAVDKLAKAKVTTRRDEVARALDPLLKDTNFWHRGACLSAVGVWGTKDNVPSLLPLLDDKDGWRRVAVVKILGNLRDERAAEPIAKMLPNWFGRAEASEALQKIGSKAEKVVLPFLTHADAGARAEACKILAVIGTRLSKPALDKASTDSNPGVANEAKKAAAAVAKRA